MEVGPIILLGHRERGEINPLPDSPRRLRSGLRPPALGGKERTREADFQEESAGSATGALGRGRRRTHTLPDFLLSQVGPTSILQNSSPYRSCTRHSALHVHARSSNGERRRRTLLTSHASRPAGCRTVSARASRHGPDHRRKRGHSTFPFRGRKSRMSPFPFLRRDRVLVVPKARNNGHAPFKTG